jgi:hypothetical protein
MVLTDELKCKVYIQSRICFGNRQPLLMEYSRLNIVEASVADPDPVGSGTFWSDPDPGLHK